jgi:hypothetical protein
MRSAPPVRTRIVGLSATVALTAGLLAACSSMTPGGRAAAGPTDSSVPATTSPAKDAAPSDLPASCTAAAVLPPVSATPTFPSGYQILDALPAALANQYPTVYAGIEVAPATAGESAAVANSHFIVLETTRDPSLEAEATAAYASPLTVAFELSPRSWVCLQDVQADVEAAREALRAAGITMIGDGLRMPNVVVDVTACTPSSEQGAVGWFDQRWGPAVTVTTCATIPTDGTA